MLFTLGTGGNSWGLSGVRATEASLEAIFNPSYSVHVLELTLCHPCNHLL